MQITSCRIWNRVVVSVITMITITSWALQCRCISFYVMFVDICLLIIFWVCIKILFQSHTFWISMISKLTRLASLYNDFLTNHYNMATLTFIYLFYIRWKIFFIEHAFYIYKKKHISIYLLYIYFAPKKKKKQNKKMFNSICWNKTYDHIQNILKFDFCSCISWLSAPGRAFRFCRPLNSGHHLRSELGGSHQLSHKNVLPCDEWCIYVGWGGNTKYLSQWWLHV